MRAASRVGGIALTDTRSPRSCLAARVPLSARPPGSAALPRLSAVLAGLLVAPEHGEDPSSDAYFPFLLQGKRSVSKS